MRNLPSQAELFDVAPAARVAAAEHLWTVAVNNWGGAGRWAFLEITDPWDAEHLIRERFARPLEAQRR
jgi:hypothetical protein